MFKWSYIGIQHFWTPPMLLDRSIQLISTRYFPAGLSPMKSSALFFHTTYFHPYQSCTAEVPISGLKWCPTLLVDFFRWLNHHVFNCTTCQFDGKRVLVVRHGEVPPLETWDSKSTSMSQRCPNFGWSSWKILNLTSQMFFGFLLTQDFSIRSLNF